MFFQNKNPKSQFMVVFLLSIRSLSSFSTRAMTDMGKNDGKGMPHKLTPSKAEAT
jgi:hypothetical protein